MYDPTRSWNHKSEDSLRQCMHEAAAEHVSPIIWTISCEYNKDDCFNFVEPMWYGRSYPRSAQNWVRKGGNEFSYQKEWYFQPFSLSLGWCWFWDQEPRRHAGFLPPTMSYVTYDVVCQAAWCRTSDVWRPTSYVVRLTYDIVSYIARTISYVRSLDFRRTTSSQWRYVRCRTSVVLSTMSTYDIISGNYDIVYRY